ncbi:Ankyrin repeat-containing domain [Phytophthora cactorum]|nr:Ankyrin repeat-containing domain [Phytophthora cactorum]
MSRKIHKYSTPEGSNHCPFLAALLDKYVAVPNADGTPRNLAQLASEDADVRLLAVLWLKHFLKAQWRARKSTNQLSDEERAHVRGVLLFAALHEPQQTVALHLALIVATIARAEFPAQWSFETLFPMILHPLRRPNGAVDLPRERRGVDVSYRVVKELAARRLMQHRKQFAMLSVELLPLLLQYWTATATQLNNFLQTQGEAAEQTNGEKTATIITALMTTGADQLNVLVTTTKLISMMLLNAFRDLSTLQNGELMRSALVEFYNQLERLVKFRQAFLALVGDAGATDVEEAIQTLDKCMHRIAAIVVGVQNSYPMEFCEYLPPYLTLFWNVLNAFSSVHPTALPLPRRLQIEALQFFANVLSCRLYKNESLSGPDGTTRIITKVITATGDVALTDAMVLEAQAAVQTFFTQTENRFASMLNLVVMHYMTLTTKDLDEWHSDPEAYCTLMESLTAKESVRACAENVFLTLVQNFPDQTIPALTQITSSASTYLVELGRGQVSTGADRRVLEMDAVLLAIGLGCYDLHDCFEFEPWFLTNLVPILVNQDAAVGSFQGFPVMRFRIVWLVSCWLAQLSANVRPPLYDALLNPSASFHQADADVALKLRVIQTLESMVNDWGFEHDAFAPFLTRALECLFAFFPQADESESKMKVLGCLEAIIQGCGPQIVSFCHQISAPLPALWTNESDASNLVRGKILQLMAKLLSSVKEAPSVETGSVQELLGMCVQVIRFATDVSNPDEVFLMESGLELWNETLEVSSVYTEELHQLFGNVLRLMERDYEHVALVLSLLEHYLRLGKAQFWQTYHTNVSGLLQSVIGNVKAEASLQIAQVTEIIVATVPIDQTMTVLFESTSDTIYNFLLRRGGDVNIKNSKGDTPLHAHAESWNASFVNGLVEHGADVDALDKQGGFQDGCNEEEDFIDVCHILMSHKATHLLQTLSRARLRIQSDYFDVTDCEGMGNAAQCWDGGAIPYTGGYLSPSCSVDIGRRSAPTSGRDLTCTESLPSTKMRAPSGDDISSLPGCPEPEPVLRDLESRLKRESSAAWSVEEEVSVLSESKVNAMECQVNNIMASASTKNLTDDVELISSVSGPEAALCVNGTPRSSVSDPKPALPPVSTRSGLPVVAPLLLYRLKIMSASGLRRVLKYRRQSPYCICRLVRGDGEVLTQVQTSVHPGGGEVPTWRGQVFELALTPENTRTCTLQTLRMRRSSLRPRQIDIHARMRIIREEEDLDADDDGTGGASQPHATFQQLVANLEARQKAGGQSKRNKKDIPIPVILPVPSYDISVSADFEVPTSYVRFQALPRDEDATGSEALGPESQDVEVDLDLEDMRWLRLHPKYGVDGDPRYQLSQERFGQMLDALEKASALLNPNVMTLAEAEDVFAKRLSMHKTPLNRVTCDVYAYWAAKRQKLRRPLLRRFWPQTPLNDTNPHAVFRPREKERYKLRKHRKNDLEGFRKLQQLRVDFERVRRLLDLVRRRERAKRLQLDFLDEIRRQAEHELTNRGPNAAVRKPVIPVDEERERHKKKKKKKKNIAMARMAA